MVAVAFQPLRERVQRSVNQMVYGYRDQPEVVLRELARSLGSEIPPQGVLSSLAATLGRTLRLPTVLLEVEGDQELSARHGGGPRDGLVEAARASSGGTLLRVLAAPRRGGALTARDRQLLTDIAPSLAATAESLRLQRALDTARVRAVTALAEDQRRMRRDLHDGRVESWLGCDSPSARPARWSPPTRRARRRCWPRPRATSRPLPTTCGGSRTTCAPPPSMIWA